MPRLGLRRTVFLVVALATFSGCAGREGRALAVSAPEGRRVQAGRSVPVAVKVAVREGLHVQANPASRETLIPFTLEVEARDGVSLSGVRYPDALEKAGGRFRVYSGSFEVRAEVLAAAGARPGRVRLPARLRYQACDDAGTCRFPATEVFELEVEVVSAGAEGAAEH